MLTLAITFIQQHIVPLGSLGIFLICFLDETFPIIPASTLLLLTGVFFLQGVPASSLLPVLIFKMALPGAIGLTLGSMIIYTIAYYGGKPVIDRFGGWINVRWQDVENFDRRITAHYLEDWLLAVLWALPIIPSGFFGIFGGTTRMPWKRYMTLTFVGTFFKALSMYFVGWLVGAVYLKYLTFIDRFEKAIGVLIIFLIVGYIWYRKSHKKVLE